MGKIISIVNQKGGVGKTTTTINLAASLAMYKQKVLIIDYDQQANTTIGLGINREDILFDVTDFFTHIGLLRKAIIKTKVENLHLIASSIKLANIEDSLYMIPDKEYLLKRKLDMIKNEYDFILIDCPPSLGLIVDNALYASDSVLIPVECGFYSYEALTQMINKIDKIQQINNDYRGINKVTDVISFALFDFKVLLLKLLSQTGQVYVLSKTYSASTSSGSLTLTVFWLSSAPSSFFAESSS